MIDFFQAGGFSMFFVLLFGMAAFGATLAFARKPKERRVGVIRALSTAAVFSTLAGVVANVAAVFSHVPNNPEWAHSPDLHLIVIAGLGESLAPAILGFSLLSVSWVVTAVGIRRLDDLESAA